jgi:LPS-assembly protein
VKAARIIHDEGEKMMYFEQAQLEFFGKPVAYFPYFSAPDPTVKRKSGFLIPTFSSSSKVGFSAEIPYFWALAPNYDLTLTPTITTRQGPLMQAEFRHRLMNGAYSIRAAGIRQLDKDYFVYQDGANQGQPTPGYRDWRGAIESSGQFALNQRWVWGWDALLVSDKTFYQDYHLSTLRTSGRDPFGTTSLTTYDTGISQLYLSGAGSRSYFDIRGIHYYGFSSADVQKQLPVIHPVMDYAYTVDQPILGGQLSFKTNLTSLSRQEADFDSIRSSSASAAAACATMTADTAAKNCLLRGAPGNYTRFSVEANWKRTITDQFGQVFTPFASLRADAATMDIRDQSGVANFINTGDASLVRAMPTIGLEYRYPFINVQSWGTQTIEPIAQVIARPNEQLNRRLPNEDAQSLIFDDSNLFRVDKFSGWDRQEGGGRANYGLQYTMQFNQGGFINALFGQSYQLFGTNSYAVGDTTNTGLDSGLDTRRSDYVARLSYQPDSIYSVSTRYRFDKDNFSLQRFEAEARANYDRWSVSALYGNYAAQPLLGFLNRREGILGALNVKLSPNWVVQAAARYDLDAHDFDQTRIGLGYVDDCLILGLNYITNYTYSGNPTADHRIMLQLSLRTLGDTAVATSANSLGGL